MITCDNVHKARYNVKCDTTLRCICHTWDTNRKFIYVRYNFATLIYWNRNFLTVDSQYDDIRIEILMFLCQFSSRAKLQLNQR